MKYVKRAVFDKRSLSAIKRAMIKNLSKISSKSKSIVGHEESIDSLVQRMNRLKLCMKVKVLAS